jgi:hypothetical protein
VVDLKRTNTTQENSNVMREAAATESEKVTLMERDCNSSLSREVNYKDQVTTDACGCRVTMALRNGGNRSRGYQSSRGCSSGSAFYSRHAYDLDMSLSPFNGLYARQIQPIGLLNIGRARPHEAA